MVYGTRFEIGRGVILTVGSNPTLSAIVLITNRLCVIMRIHGDLCVSGFLLEMQGFAPLNGILRGIRMESNAFLSRIWRV